MIGLDDIVNDPRFLPYRGWHDSYLTEEDARGKAGPAIQQIRSEFCGFIEVLEGLGITGSCLQIGLGKPGGAHACFSRVFSDMWTLDINPEVVHFHQSRISESKNLVIGSSFSLETMRCFSGRSFDCLFIDGDHKYEAVKQDFYNYLPFVCEGGIIAFHDTIAYPHYDENIQVAPFVNELRNEWDVHDIGSILGISYLVKHGKRHGRG